MSKNWILVHEVATKKLVKEMPTTTNDVMRDYQKACADYPAPKYTVTTAGSSAATATGNELLSGWDTEGFRDHEAAQKARASAAD